MSHSLFEEAAELSTGVENVVGFFVRCVPPTVTAQQKRAVRTEHGVRFFKGKRQVDAENDLLSLLRPYAPGKPIAGPVRLEIAAVWPFRKSDLASKAKAERCRRLGRIPHDQKPDCDNLAKALIDKLVTLGFIEDDKRVCDLRVSKYFGSEPGLGVRIAPAMCAGFDFDSYPGELSAQEARGNCLTD